MPALHTEVHFEDELVGHLVKNGWLEGAAKDYNRASALYPEDVIAWIKETQPAAYERLKKTQNGGTDKRILGRLADVLAKEGALHVFRNGFSTGGAEFVTCSFRPGNSLNPATLERYAKVRCRVVRQVHYSLNNENSIDVVLFINGIPFATLELKTDMTQTIDDAVKQYRTDRLPRDPKTNKDEPLLTFGRGAFVHFAVSTDEVQMTTRLDGAKTVFLPFNLGYNEGAGNPPTDGFRTNYLYERVLQRDSVLEIVEKFLHLEKSQNIVDGKKVNFERLIFPRYHQLDAVRSLVSTAKAEGPGKNYLIQHSAGSGKSNTIMWLCYQLMSLHNDADKKVFDSIIVVTDRQVLDDQLQATISQFEHKDGVVKRITKDGSKSAQLREALEKRTPIIIVTIQTFPYAIETIGELEDISSRSFAVIADEAHSSQTGEAAKKLRETLGMLDEAEPDGGEVSAEDVLSAQLAKRSGAKNISYFAFTATPKWKTVELFGRLGEDGKKKPFHVYSMQQAIEEGFILDVLKNYTTYDVAYKLASVDDKTVVPKSEAAILIKRAFKLHAYNIDQKVAIIVEHFRETVQPLLAGRAKAMVVCDSRKAAVRYKLAIDKYIKGKKYEIATLVAFSGDLLDDISGSQETYTEAGMNKIKGQSIPEAFGTGAYQVLLVAEKYQTGFDQPLLVAMYVDKKLANVAAVQTLSRLNRTYERDGIKKDKTFVLDFVNKPEDILTAFLPYFKVAALVEPTDPDIIHDLRTKLDQAGVYTNDDVENYFKAYLEAQKAAKGEKRQSLLKAVLDPIVERYNAWVAKAKAEGDAEKSGRAEIFKRDVATYVRAYGFLSQIFNYENTDLEKRSWFFASLSRLLKSNDEQLNLDINKIALTHYKNKISSSGHIDLKTGEIPGLKGPKDLGSAMPQEKQYGFLQEVIQAMNEVLGVGVADEHQLTFLFATAEKMAANQTLKDQATHNSFEQFKNAGDVEKIGEQSLVEAKEELVEKNDQETAALGEVMNRLFGDKEGLKSVIDAFATYVYKVHNGGAVSNPPMV
jgi:type I restriction enzyme, R subunit